MRARWVSPLVGGLLIALGAGAAAQDAAKSPADLSVAFFEAGSNNSYVQARIQAAEDWAAETGADVQVFDPNWDSQRQFEQMQTAFANPNFNGYVMTSVDPAPLCDIVTQAVSEGKLIAVMNQPLCDRAQNLGDDLWLPGTVTFVGGQTRDVYLSWMEFIRDQNPDGGQVAILTGPPTDANSQNFNAAVEEILLPAGFEIAAQQSTDYSTPQGFSAAQDIIQANPDLDLIITNWSGLTQGAAEALAASGREGIKLYDMGGTQWALDAIRSGQLESTVMLLPYLEARRSFEALAEAYLGNEVPKFINLATDPSLPGGSPFVTSENVDQYEAQF
jgi:ribose transport system substrate-binding protein